MPQKVHIVTTGGTIDKVYFDANSEFEVGDSEVATILARCNVTREFEVTNLLRKDSLELDDEDRELIRRSVAQSPHAWVVVTHGTDTMLQTAECLVDIAGKTIVLTGSLVPARFRDSDAVFNVAAAFTAVQCLPPGVYVVMNGRVFDPGHARKNRGLNRFEEA